MINPYLLALHRVLPRLLSFYNMDSTSKLYGVGDRYYWAWKLIDFPNGTYQAAVHGLALLFVHNLLPDFISKKEILFRINTLIIGLKNILSKNGSLDEALPNESSFCVTALVASDVLAAFEILKPYMSSEQSQAWLHTIEPMIEFLKKQDEYHGLISNHLASAALAMFRWYFVAGDLDAKARGQFWLDRILKCQSLEGWYNEYGGPDPGYQTWCTTQLAQLYLLTNDTELKKSLENSLQFLVYAAHPDGSFGGIYGSRNTRFLLPGGVSLFSKFDKNASALSDFALKNLKNHNFVTIDSVDEGNLVPFFNDYALAAVALMNNKEFLKPSILPCFNHSFRKYFSDSRWLIDKGENYYTLINFNKGGAVIHFDGGLKTHENPGAILRNNRGDLFSTYKSKPIFLGNIDLTTDSINVDFDLQKVLRPYPKALDFLLLRFFSLTFFKSLALGNFIKRVLSYYLIKRKNKPVGFVRKKYFLGKDFRLSIESDSSIGLELVNLKKHFFGVHMASQGYWQQGDDIMDNRE